MKAAAAREAVRVGHRPPGRVRARARSDRRTRTAACQSRCRTQMTGRCDGGPGATCNDGAGGESLAVSESTRRVC
jgi:hypothetical protein